MTQTQNELNYNVPTKEEMELQKKYEKNKATVLSMLNTENQLVYISEELQSDEKLMIFLLERNGLYYKYLNTKNKKNITLIQTALKQNDDVIDLLPPDVLDDEEKIVQLSNKSKFVLYCASPNIKNNKEVILKCLKNCGYGYNFINNTLKDDRDVIEATLRERIELALLMSVSLLETHYDYFMSIGIDYTKQLNKLKSLNSQATNVMFANNIF